MAEGMKYDGGKPRWSLLDRLRPVLAQVVLVLEFGAKKYAEDSWSSVPDGLRRYRDARDRHWDAILAGEALDPESGFPHWAHMTCDSLFMAWLVAFRPELVEAERARVVPSES